MAEGTGRGEMLSIWFFVGILTLGSGLIILGQGIYEFSHPGITVLWARQRVETLMDQWRQSTEDSRDALRATIIAHAIHYRLVTRFTSLVAVEQLVTNTTGKSPTVAVPSELPEGMQMDKVFGAPATGTIDAFLEALGLALMGISLAVIWGLRLMSIRLHVGTPQ